MAKLSQSAIRAIVSRLRSAATDIRPDGIQAIDKEYTAKAEAMRTPKERSLRKERDKLRNRIDTIDAELKAINAANATERDVLREEHKQAANAYRNRLSDFVLRTEMNLQLQGSDIDLDGLLNDIRNIK